MLVNFPISITHKLELVTFRAGSKGSSTKKLKRKSKSESQASANKRANVPTDSESEDAFFDEDAEGVTDLVKIEVTKVLSVSLKSFVCT